MMAPFFSRWVSGCVGVFCFLVFVPLVCGSGVFAVPQPGFLRVPVWVEIPGAKRTVYAAMVADEREGLRPATVEEFSGVEGGWDALLSTEHAGSGEILADATVELARDTNGVLTHALVSSTDPALGGVVRLSAFYTMFREKFGPEFLVAIPHRKQLLVFAKAGADWPALAAAVLGSYQSDAYAVSTEVFEVSEDGVRVVGEMEVVR